MDNEKVKPPSQPQQQLQQPGMQLKTIGRKRRRETRTCFECGKVGHTKSHCYQLRGRIRRGSEEVPTVPASRIRVDSNVQIDGHGSMRSEFTTKQVSELLANIVSGRSTSSTDQGNEDSPVDHPLAEASFPDGYIVEYTRVLKECWPIDPMTISVAENGELVVGRKRGVVKLKPIVKTIAKYRKLEQYDNLLIPKLKSNKHFISYSAVVDAEDDGNTFLSKM